MVRSLYTWPLFFLLTVTGYWFMVTGASPVLERTPAQYVAFPLFLVFLWKVPLKQFSSLYKSAVLCAILFTAFGARIAFAPPSSAPRTVVLARLTGDVDEIQSRLLREGINDAMKGMKIKLVRYFEEFHSFKEVRAKFAHESNPRPIVWGSPRLIHLSFPPSTDAVNTAVDKALYELAGLRISASVDDVALSIPPQRETAEFIAALAEGYLYDEGSHEIHLAEREYSLLKAAGIWARWRSSEHRAVPFLKLAVLSTYRALAEGRSDKGEIACALNYLKLGQRMFRTESNPELRAILFNNQAVLFQVYGVLSGESKFSKRSVTYLKRASKVVKRYKLGGNVQNLVRTNLSVMKKTQKLKKSRKHAKAHQERAPLNKSR